MMQPLDKLTEHTLPRPGCRLHYWLGGAADRPLVALLHGATMDHRMFEEQIVVLLGEYRVLVWDARSHGKSRPAAGDFDLGDCADDLLAILDHLGVEQAALVGQSMGGYIAQQFYLRYPQRARAIVIIGATSIALPYSRLDVWTLKATLPLFNVWPYAHLIETVARNTAIQPAVRDYARRTVSQLSRKEFLAIWKAVTLTVSREGIPGHHIRVPLLLTHGDQDNTGTIRRDAPKWAAYEPDVRYVVIPDAGHNANQDNPAFFNRLLLEFLREHVPAVYS